MTYVIGAVAGLALGALAALIKYLLLWKPLLKGRRNTSMKNIGIMQAGSMAINIVVLLGIFFLRHLWPYSFEATLVAAALGLSLFTRLSPLREMGRLEQNQKNEPENHEDYTKVE